MVAMAAAPRSSLFCTLASDVLWCLELMTHRVPPHREAGAVFFPITGSVEG